MDPQINKDLPLGLSPTSDVALGFSEPIPEPVTGSLLAFGLVWLALRSCRRRA